jgi:iron complex transport system substrate-binding protein
MKDKSIKVLTAVLLFLIFLACSAAAQDEGAYPKTIVDSAGRTISIPLPVERIIVLNSDAAEAAVTLGAGNRIVGITEEILGRSSHLPDLRDKQVIGTSQMGGEIDYELIGEIATAGSSEPSDLLVIGFSGAGKDYGAAEVEKKLAPFGIINAGLDFYQPENLSREMTVLGIILDREEEASDYLKWREEKMQSVEGAVSGLSLPSVYLERSPKNGLGDLITFGNGSGLNDLAQTAGGRNIAGNLAKSAHVAWEWVLSEDPDVIVRTMSSEGSLGWESGPSQDALLLQKTVREILERPGANSISAAKNGDIFIVYSDMLYGMESVAGLAYLAKALHPEADLDPDIIYREYFERLGLGFPENRTFVYRED